MDSPQISLSLGSGSSKSSGSHSSHNSGSNSNSGVQRIPRKMKRRRVRECAEAIEGDDDDVEIEIDESPAGRSYVWLHFRKIKKTFYGMKDGKRVVVDEIERAQCIHCESDFACDSHSNGTSTLKRHIEIVCKHYPGRVDIEGEQQDTRGTKDLVMEKWTQQGCREAAVKMIVMDELPFSHIEKEVPLFLTLSFVFKPGKNYISSPKPKPRCLPPPVNRQRWLPLPRGVGPPSSPMSFSSTTNPGRNQIDSLCIDRPIFSGDDRFLRRGFGPPSSQARCL
ncbi:hypothetical protein ACLB2K_012118 [Fragaria x ananassa]